MTTPSFSQSSALATAELDRSALTSDGSGCPQGKQTRRVLHLINGEHFAGAERVQDLLALALPQFGYEVEFARVLPGRFDQARRSTVARPPRSGLTPGVDTHFAAAVLWFCQWLQRGGRRGAGYLLVRNGEADRPSRLDRFGSAVWCQA